MAANMTRAELVARVKDLADVADVSAIHTALATYRGLTTEKNYEADKRALHAAIDQLAAHQAEGWQGWKLVPIEPTQEMKLAGTFAPNFRASESVWRAMLWKAPAIPTDSPGAVGGGAGEPIDLGINGSRCGTHGTSGT